MFNGHTEQRLLSGALHVGSSAKERVKTIGTLKVRFPGKGGLQIGTLKVGFPGKGGLQISPHTMVPWEREVAYVS